MARGGRRPGSGRKPKPDYLKLLEGNPGKRTITDGKDKNSGYDAGNCRIKMPSWLDSEAKKVWKSLKPALLTAGALEETDSDTLGMLCATYSRWKNSNSRLYDADTVAAGIVEMIKAAEPHQRAEIEEMLKAFCQYEESRQSKLEEKYFARLKWLLVEFGMTPSSRSRIDSGSGEAGKKDPLDDWLNKKKKH
jgi:P27 family predicted phage terminase small subunit